MYNSENRPKEIAIEAEEELDEDDKVLTIPKSEVVRVIKDMRRKKVTGDDNITQHNVLTTRRSRQMTTYQSIYSRNWETVD